ncbi:hypothetical protein AOCH_000307 [Aspergillus ochraceoroseus]|uniref:Uncharacterized protein n=1 Tax=Aspergillus ochraceoroseus TaxID=138278 RepID=A0A0F8WMF8_9EURO|nr:hypothetical protein AOCH_000307 [Aspergillus ochraceoroseus]
MAEVNNTQEEKHGVSVALDEGTKVGTMHGESAQEPGAKTKAVHSAELFAAINETKIERWSKTSLHLYCA